MIGYGGARGPCTRGPWSVGRRHLAFGQLGLGHSLVIEYWSLGIGAWPAMSAVAIFSRQSREGAAAGDSCAPGKKARASLLIQHCQWAKQGYIQPTAWLVALSVQ